MPLSVDNAAIHHTQEAVDAIHATGAMVIFLPPYTPDFMPLEELFAQVKNWIRENDAAWQFCQDPDLMVEEAFLQNIFNLSKNIFYYNLGIIVNLKSTEFSQKFLLLTNKLVI